MKFTHSEYEELKQHLSLSHSVFEIAKCFVSLDDYNQVINRALNELGMATNAGRSYLFQFNAVNKTMDNTHEWCIEGVSPEIENLKGLPIDLFPWWMKKLTNGEIIDVKNVDSMSDNARAEREILQAQSIKSVLVLPVLIEGSLSGFVGLDNVKADGTWDREAKDYLRVAADMIGMAIVKHSTEEQILEQNRRLERAYKDLKLAQAQIVHSEKLAGIGQLAAGIAHEINNPIGFVTSNTESLGHYITSIKKILELSRSGASFEEIKAEAEAVNLDFIMSDMDELLNENKDGLARVAEIVNNLRDFVRIDQKSKYAEADINTGLHSALLMANNEIKYHADVQTHFGDIPLIFCDAGEINQVFLNILVNAAQAIRDQNRSEKGIIDVRTYAEKDSVICLISDDGPGVPENILSEIFNPFFTTKEVGKGTGLGLSISYDIIVNKHRGKLSVVSSDWGGAAFRIELPIKGDPGNV